MLQIALQVKLTLPSRTAVRRPTMHIMHDADTNVQHARAAIQEAPCIAINTLLSAVPEDVMHTFQTQSHQQARTQTSSHTAAQTWQSCTSSVAVLSWPVPGGPQNFKSGLTNLAKCPRLHASTPS